MFPNLNSKINKRGFTLIELLVVIAILAALAVAVVITLNPAELIKRARDATRVSDLASIQHAVALYWTEVDTPVWVAAGPECTATTSKPGGTSGCTLNNTTVVTGTGWVRLNFTSIVIGSPLGKLPLDPVNGTCAATGTPSLICNYAFKASSTSTMPFKLGSNLESIKYIPLEGTDGGTVADWYEVGNTDIAW